MRACWVQCAAEEDAAVFLLAISTARLMDGKVL